VVEISRAHGLQESDQRRCSEILTFAINLEHVGDKLDMSLRALAARKIKNRLALPLRATHESTTCRNASSRS